MLSADTIRVMQYNLMYYTHQTPSDCIGDENYLKNKDLSFYKICRYLLPDVLCVNEIGGSATYVNRFLDSAIHAGGENDYRAVPLPPHFRGQIANMLYYRPSKMAFHSQFEISTNLRDINAFCLYEITPAIAQGDTVFVTFIQAHLKAGYNYESDRESEIFSLMSKLEQIGHADNYVLLGDFNLYTAEEPAYQLLTHPNNTLYQFYDPLDREGAWNNNRTFADIHTQSTHTRANTGECFSTGGLDDRFDLILISPYIFYGNNGVSVVNGSYRAFGNDGNLFNREILGTTSVPSEIALALYNMSDHLPVLMNLYMEAGTGTGVAARRHQWAPLLRVETPVRNDQLTIYFQPETSGKYVFDIFSGMGQKIVSFEEECTAGLARTTRRNFPYPSGFYYLVISDPSGKQCSAKTVK
jgi:hypothetical protein